MKLRSADMADGPTFYKELIDLLYNVRQNTSNDAVFNSPVCNKSKKRVGSKKNTRNVDKKQHAPICRRYHAT